MSQADLRNFNYRVEPLRRRQISHCDQAQLQLAKINRQAQAAQEQLSGLRDALAQEAAQASQSWRTRLDPRSHGHVLDYLAQSQSAIARIDTELQQIQLRKQEARKACEAAQRRLDVIEKHRESCLRDHVTHEHQRSAIHADEDWSLRQLWTQKGGTSL